MIAKPLLKLLFLAPLFVLPAYAETNAAGEEIILLGNTETAGDDLPWYATESLQLTRDEGEADTSIAERNTDNPSRNLWQRIKNGFGMPEVQSPFTSTHESWYASRPDYVKRMISRSQRYLYHIVEEVEKRGMPSEIALLPMIESAFNPQAYSRSHASGIWQFVPATGKHFGLKQNWWVDNRRDVMAATDAALNYLQKLHVMFGSWDLALAAYNAGEGTVMRAIERNRKKGLPTDYQSLNLPPETKNYVPKLQAVKNIVANPQQYGLEIQPIPDQPYFTTVAAPSQIDAHLAAKLAGISFEEFSSLNPEYNRPVLTSSTGSHEILLPIGADQTFVENLASYDKPLVSWQTYYAKRGERQEAIARKFGISLAQLRNVNDLPARSKLGAPRPLLVPAQGNRDNTLLNEATLEEATKVEAPTSKADVRRHTVRKGDTLAGIAKQYGLSSRQLIIINHLKSDRLKIGQTLMIRPNTPNLAKVQVGNKETVIRRHYVVRHGDTLTSIARKFNVAANDLQRWNNLNSTHLVPGKKLKILKPDAA